MINFNEFISAIFVSIVFAKIPASIVSGITSIFHRINGEDRIKIDFKNND